MGHQLIPVEMGMPDKNRLFERLKADSNLLQGNYGSLWRKHLGGYRQNLCHYGKSHWRSSKKHELFAPFSSKYDRALKGEAELTALEAEGKALFFDKTRTNCSNCHQSSETNSAKETFTNYRYFNIGVPSNQELIKFNKLAADFVDNGLLDNPMVKGDESKR